MEKWAAPGVPSEPASQQKFPNAKTTSSVGIVTAKDSRPPARRSRGEPAWRAREQARQEAPWRGKPLPKTVEAETPPRCRGSRIAGSQPRLYSTPPTASPTCCTRRPSTRATGTRCGRSEVLICWCRCSAWGHAVPRRRLRRRLRISRIRPQTVTPFARPGASATSLLCSRSPRRPRPLHSTHTVGSRTIGSSRRRTRRLRSAT